jgi:hypothetical protein
MGFAMGRTKEVISMHMSGDHGREKMSTISHSYEEMKGRRRGEGQT